MSAMASRVPLLLDMATQFVLRAPRLGVEVASGVEMAGRDGELPPWLTPWGGPIVTFINVTALQGSCEVGLVMWSNPNAPVVTVWSSPVVLGAQTHVIDPSALFAAAPEDPKLLGVGHTLTGQDAHVDFSMVLTRGIRP
jgi:hypothetical protein